MPPDRTTDSRGMTITTRNRTHTGATPEQTIQNLVRNGDFAWFPISQRRSIKRYASFACIAVRVRQIRGKGYVERLGDEMGRDIKEMFETAPAMAYQIMDDKLEDLKWDNKRLKKYMIEAIIKWGDADPAWCRMVEEKCKLMSK